MTKKVLVSLIGLPRTYKQTCDNFFNFLIEPNMITNEYTFDILIHSYFVNDEIKDDVCNKYNKYSQIKEVFNVKLPENIPIEHNQLRINDILKRYKVDDYLLLVFIRMDLLISKAIDMSKYERKFSCINGINIRPNQFHHRDWNLCFISDVKSFFLWIHPYSLFCKYISGYNDMKYEKNSLYQNEWEKYENIIEERDYTLEDIQMLSKKYGIIGEISTQFDYMKIFERNEYDTFIYLFKAIHNLDINKCSFEFSKKNETFVSILRG